MTVVRGGALGDFVVTLPLLRALATGGRRVRLVGNREAASALFAPDAESVDDERWMGLFADGVDLPAATGAALVLMRDAAVARRVLAGGWEPVVAGRPFPGPESGLHVVDHLLAVSGLVGANAVPWVEVDAVAVDGWRRRFGEGYAVVHPGSGSARKNWPGDRFAEVARRRARGGSQVVQLMGPAEQGALATAGEIVRAAGQSARGASSAMRGGERGEDDAEGGVEVVAGLELREVSALLAGADLYVGNDSGISHLAAAVGAPTVAIFGPTRAARWAPRGPNVSVLEPSRRCALCAVAEERAAACDCIGTIAVEQVLAEIEEVARRVHPAS